MMVLSVHTGWTRTELLALSVDEMVHALNDLADVLKPPSR